MRAIVTVTGKDTTKIIGRICTLLGDNDINILDISQTVMQEFFTMSMLVDISACKKDIIEIADELKALGKEMGLVIHAQREDIFTLMHRV